MERSFICQRFYCQVCFAPMYHDSPVLWKDHLEQGLRDDIAQWDLTSNATVSGTKKSRAKILAKEEGVWAAEGLNQALANLSHSWGAKIEIRSSKKNGTRLKRGGVASSWTGSAQAILRFERTYLNLATYVCGIASQTQRLIQKMNQTDAASIPRLTPTRKILPYYRDLALLGVVIGGGHLHRMNLAGGILIKENHIRAAGGITQSLKRARVSAPHPLRLEIEVRNLKELDEALRGSADVVMLDNFQPSMVQAAVSRVRKKKSNTIIEVSGGITEETIQEYTISGVDVISVGSLTHSIKGMDLSLLIE